MSERILSGNAEFKIKNAGGIKDLNRDMLMDLWEIVRNWGTLGGKYFRYDSGPLDESLSLKIEWSSTSDERNLFRVVNNESMPFRRVLTTDGVFLIGTDLTANDLGYAIALADRIAEREGLLERFVSVDNQQKKTRISKETRDSKK